MGRPRACTGRPHLLHFDSPSASTHTPLVTVSDGDAEAVVALFARPEDTHTRAGAAGLAALVAIALPGECGHPMVCGK